MFFFCWLFSLVLSESQLKEGVQGLQAFVHVKQLLMMNIRNLVSKESLWVKFKDGICSELENSPLLELVQNKRIDEKIAF